MITHTKVKKLIQDYKESTPYQTYRGFLLYAGIGSIELNELKGALSYELENGKVGNATRCFKELEKYKTELEVKMEEYLLYQGKHKEISGIRFYNYENVKFLLRCSNRDYYNPTGNVLSVNSKKSSKEDVIKIEPNKSEISILELTNDTNKDY